MSNEYRVCIGVANPGVYVEGFAISLMGMMMAFREHQLDGAKQQMSRLASVKGSLLPKQRLDALKHAEEMEATHLLFLDSDHTFPADLLHRLLRHNKDIVALNFAVKKFPSGPTARLTPTEKYPGGVPVFSNPESPQLEKVWRVGFGCMLIRMEVFAALPYKGHSVFGMRYEPSIDNYVGEDWTFCEEAEKAGFDIWVDHKWSLKCGHVGSFNYTHDLIISDEDAEILSQQFGSAA